MREGDEIKMTYDFSGWATRNDILCTDGRTIRKDAFKDCDGKKVPLVWNHQHNDPENVLGSALLHNEDEGVRCYCSFNNTRKAQSAKMMVEHGDVDSLSIYANRLKQNGGDVLHGDIKEVSLVLAGANSGAYIDEVIRHGEIFEDEAIVYPGEQIELYHAADMDAAKPEPKTEKKEPEEKDDDGETVGDVFNTLTEKQKNVVYALIALALSEGEDGEAKHSDEDEGEIAEHADKSDDDDDGETVGDVFNTLTEKQKNMVYALIGQALESKKEAKHSDEDETEEDKEEEYEGEEDETDSENTEGGNEMKHNIFEGGQGPEEVLTHSEQVQILEEAKNGKYNLKDVVLQHGITNINNAYPDYKSQANAPEFIKEDQGWVTTVLNGVHHTPFSRIKTLFADITEADARAKGYLTKNTQKIEEVITLLKRETPPTTIYKLQKLDRDDLLDITDFDAVAWLKEEMMVKLREEEARAYLIGDGRGATASDKIDEQKIRPIWTMEELFAIPAVATVASTATTDDIAKAVIRAAVKGFDTYDGSGNTIAFVSPDLFSDMLLLEDGFGHRLYDTKEKLASAMLVNKVVAVPPMKNKTRTVTVDSTDHTRNLAAIIVDLRDYNVGMDKGGQVNFFDDFVLDFNKLEYLVETRQSGTLVKPKSAIVVEYEVSGN